MQITAVYYIKKDGTAISVTNAATPRKNRSRLLRAEAV